MILIKNINPTPVEELYNKETLKRGQVYHIPFFEDAGTRWKTAFFKERGKDNEENTVYIFALSGNSNIELLPSVEVLDLSEFVIEKGDVKLCECPVGLNLNNKE